MDDLQAELIDSLPEAELLSILKGEEVGMDQLAEKWRTVRERVQREKARTGERAMNERKEFFRLWGRETVHRSVSTIGGDFGLLAACGNRETLANIAEDEALHGVPKAATCKLCLRYA